MKSILTRIIALMVLLSMVVAPVSANDSLQAIGPGRQPDRSGFVPETTGPKQSFVAAEPDSVVSLSKTGRYVILFEKPSLAAVSKDVEQLDTTTPQSKSYLETLAVQRNQVLAAAQTTLGRTLKVGFVYDVILNGVSIEMSAEEAQQVANIQGVRKVLPVTLEQPDTDAGPTFIGADGIWTGTTAPNSVGTEGEGVIVGILDTGINFDHPSFSDTPEDAFVYTWTGDYLGVCNPTTGEVAYASACNDKLVGAYSFTTETVSPEDAEGHGSHTASTVAGNYVTFNFMGVNTTISGVAPHAQIIAYDVCDPSGCYGDASAAAVQQAILNGVDVINYSISGGKDPYNDIAELAFLEAFGADIMVATSGGNLRTEPSTDGQVNHLSPWVITVAASSHNRKFTNDIDVVQPVASPYVNLAVIQSTSPVPFPALDNVELRWAGEDTASTSANYSDNREGCAAFPADFFLGKIALIMRGVCNFTVKVANAQAAGAIGVLAYADARPPLSMGGLDAATIPAAMFYLSSADSAAFAAYVAANAPVLLDLSVLGRYLNDAWGDIKADFSFRGPSANNMQVLKPEITAPGLEILAAVSDGVVDVDHAVQAELYQGTSMSSPHTAGSGALLSALFPTWSAAQVKSALMLTAETEGLKKEDMSTPADLFDFGAGRVDLELASLTGLTMDESYDNMVAAETGDVSSLNLASLYNSLCVGECSWTRTFTSVSGAAATYTAVAPAWITVNPANFTIPAGGTQVVTFTADVTDLTSDEWAFAYVAFTTDSLHSGGKAVSDVSIPLAVLPVSSNVPAFVRFETHRDADMGTIPDLLALEFTDGNTYESGLTKATLENVQLDPDPTNGSATDDLTQVFVKRLDIPAYSIRVVAEITKTTAADIDMFLYYDADGNGTLGGIDLNYLVASSATSAALEYINAPKGWIYWNADDTYFVVVQNWDGAAGDTFTLATGVVPLSPEVGNYDVIVPATNPAGEPFQIDVFWNEDTEEGDRLYGYFDTCADAACNDWVGATDFDVRRLVDDVIKTASGTTAVVGDTLTYTIEITNYADVAVDYTINDVLPDGVTYVSDSVTGGAVYDAGTNAITWAGTVESSIRDYVSTTSAEDPACSLAIVPDGDPTDAYLDWKTTSYGFSASATISGDSKWYGGAFTAYPPFNFYGVDYIDMEFTDDGYAGFNMAAVDYINQNLPDPTNPNNVLAIFWDDFVIQYNSATNKGVTIVGDEASFATIEYDDVYLYDGDPSVTMDMEVGYFLQPDDTPGFYEIVYAFDNINPALLTAATATIGVENADATMATLISYNDPLLTIADGSAICFDWAVVLAPPKVITFQVTVDKTPVDGLLINEALHDNNAPGTLEEAAKAVVQLPLEPKINEFSNDTAPGGDYEYIELIGSPNTDYSDYVVLEIESNLGSNPGFIDNQYAPKQGVFSVGTTDANGLYLISLSSNTIENSSITLLLVKDFTGADGDDIDTDDNGVIDFAPWSSIADSIAVDNVDTVVDYAYAGAPQLYEYYDRLRYAPGGASRIPDGVDTDTVNDWVRNDFNGAGLLGYAGTPIFGEAYNTPGAFNMVVPNTAPVAVADTYTTAEDTQLVVAVAQGVLANDTDADGTVLTAELVTNVTNGTLLLAADGSFTYTPGTNFFGEDSFTYKAYDGDMYSGEVTATISVTTVNDAPVAVGDTYTTEEDTQLVVAIAQGVLANDTDVELATLTAALVSDVTSGALALAPDGSFTYMPDFGFFGEDSFTYKAFDGLLYSDTVTVTITVTEVVTFTLYMPVIFR